MTVTTTKADVHGLIIGIMEEVSVIALFSVGDLSLDLIASVSEVLGCLSTHQTSDVKQFAFGCVIEAQDERRVSLAKERGGTDAQIIEVDSGVASTPVYVVDLPSGQWCGVGVGAILTHNV